MENILKSTKLFVELLVKDSTFDTAASLINEAAAPKSSLPSRRALDYLDASPPLA